MIDARRWLLVLALLALAACQSPSSVHREPVRSSPGPIDATDPFERAREAIDAAHDLGLPPGNYRVDVDRVWLAETDSSAIGVMFGYAKDGVIVEGGGPVPGEGLRIGVVGPDGFAAVSAAWRSARQAEQSSLFLVTMANFPASLLVGETRWPDPIRLAVPGRRDVIVIPAQQFLGAGLDVVVTPAGRDVVHVELTPFFSGLASNGDDLRITELTTRVAVPLGHTLLVASHDRTLDDVVTTMFSRTSTSGVEQGVIMLTVTGG